jgi:radical SAM superfamily enzyme YgiQ (UPF0313 family)
MFGYSVRLLSSILRRHGHETRLAFIRNTMEPLSDKAADSLIECMKGVDLVGISLISVFFDRSVEVTRLFQERLGVPVLWGGVHPTAHPEECLGIADIVCEGEGEEAICEVADAIAAGRSLAGIQNIRARDGAGIVSTPPRPLLTDLDSLPFPDYSEKEHFFYDSYTGMFVPVDVAKKSVRTANVLFETRTSKGKNHLYGTISSRGCPYHCTYCVESMYRNRFGTKEFLRMRSVDNVIEELIAMKEIFPEINCVMFYDDNFFIRRQEDLQYFMTRFNKDLPGTKFWGLTIPAFVTEPKIRLLVNGGLVRIGMGIQTADDDVHRQVYDRSSTTKIVKRASAILHKMNRSHGLALGFDFILNNPYAGPDSDVETVQLLRDLERPYNSLVYFMGFFPGTSIYERACRDGLARRGDYAGSTACSSEETSFTWLLMKRVPPCPQWLLPKWIVHFLTAKPFVRFMNRRKSLYPVWKFMDDLFLFGNWINEFRLRVLLGEISLYDFRRAWELSRLFLSRRIQPHF